MKSIGQKFVELGHHPNDPKDERLKKSSLLVVSGPFSLAGLVWGLLYFANGLFIPGAIPFTYGILSIINIISFSYTKRYVFFRNSQLFLILILPFALQISLGGFVPSSAVIYWAIIAPAGAMFFDNIKRSLHWFGAYLTLVIIAYFINDFIPNYVEHNLTSGFINKLFLMNILGVSGIVFGILYYFVSTVTQLNDDIEKKNNALKVQSEELKEMDKVKSRFFANISHEFRTPLTLIKGLANKQKNSPDQIPGKSDTETLIRNSNRLLQLINQLLDLSKLESGEIKLSASITDLFLFTRTLTSHFESYASDINVSLRFNGTPISKQLPNAAIQLFLDRELYQKMFTNLLSNALKFVPEGGIVKVEVSVQGENAIVEVSNTGEGIPQDKLSFIFDRFYQVDSSSSRQYEGTGIGLSLVKELVGLHHGTVSVNSHDGLTCFKLELPLNSDYLQEDEKVSSPSKEGQLEISALPTQIPTEDSSSTVNTEDPNELVVLIVEDNADLRALIRGILSPYYNVEEAVDGQEGYEKAQQLIPDMIVSDVMMPRMDGYELCKKLKSENTTNHIPLVLLTAKAARENKLEGLEIGADDFLVKPFDEEELKLRIQNLINIRQKLQSRFQDSFSLKPHEVSRPSVHQQFVDGLKAILEKNIDNESFGVDDLASEANMSRSQLHRKLKALIDQPATTFIRNYRLYRAADLLKQNVGNVTEIAYQVGFNSQTYFSSSFSDLFGCSPSEYQQQEAN